MGGLDRIDFTTVHGLGKARSEGANEAQALKSFDAYFLGEMLRRTAPENPSELFDGGQAGRMYQDHLYQELARIVAETGRFGIAGSLEGRLGDAPEGELADDPGKLGASEEEAR